MAIKSDVGNVPKWLGNVSPMQGGGGNKNNNQLAQRADNNKGSNNALVSVTAKAKGSTKNNDTLKNADPQLPAWLEATIGAATGGAIQNPVIGSAAMGGYATQQSNINPKDMNTLRDNPKPYDQLVNKMLAARFDQLRGYQGKGAFDQLQQKGGVDPGYDPSGYGNGYGFGSRYGGNWGRFERSGGGDWGGSNGYNNPADSNRRSIF